MKICQIVLGSALLAATLGLVGCAGSATEGEPEPAESSSQKIAGCASWGSLWVTSSFTYLRASPSASGAVLRGVAEGSYLVMADSCPENGFYRVHIYETDDVGYILAERIAAPPSTISVG